jgi:tetratricopeptide (TPR) repeat protein
MTDKPVVFISSTSDLRSARELVGTVLYSMGYEPVWQEIEATDGGELLDVLRRRIGRCSLMVQLVGQRYGAEPPSPTTEFGRVSYTQFEGLYAERIGKKVIYHFIDPAFPTDPSAAEEDDRRDLQAAYRLRIESANKLRQTIVSSQDLELSIRRISNELAAARKQSDARFRRMFWLVTGSLAGMAAVAVLVVSGFHLLHSKQEEQTIQAASQSQQLERIEKLLIGQKHTNPQTAPQLSVADQAILDEAKEQGDLKSRLAASVLRPDAQTDAMLDQLRAQRDAQAYVLAMLEGKRWYFDRLPQYDEAVPFFEQAMSLQPDSLDARNYAASAHSLARLGDLTAQRKRAIEICQGSLKIAVPGSADWARTQINLGNAWCAKRSGDQDENLRNAIAAYEAALTVYTKVADPSDWATTQIDLGNAWNATPTSGNGENLRNAIAAYEAALTVFTADADPSNWAGTENNLGTAWGMMPTGDKGQNLRNAIAAYEAALTVFTRDAYPGNWAMTLNNLGNAWQRIPLGDKGQNLHNAIAAYDAALTVYTKDADPSNWAQAQFNFSMALADMAQVQGEDPIAWLARALASDKAALLVFTAAAFPLEHVKAEKNMEIDRRAYEATGAAATRPFEAIEAAQ